MREVNVYEFGETLTATFQRYLFTRNFIADSEPELRQAFWEALQARNCFARPPLLSAIPAYQAGATMEEMIARSAPPRLRAGLARVAAGELDLRRPLYQHQVESIELIQNGRNLVVASGTGSGKTECFLLPILDDVLRRPGKGVRAIIIYPLNALANDQLGRLRSLLRDMPEITFGRYTGETPETMEKVTDRERTQISANERFTREQIRSDPPDILLTNFAMLEYLLLRPGDNPVFHPPRLRFVVLDEAHTYSGAQGIEVSLLMRRLRECYSQTALQFILTSATLARQDEEAGRQVADFAGKLTGAKFEASDVLFGHIVDRFDSECRSIPFDRLMAVVPDERAFSRWLDNLQDASALRSQIIESGLQVAKEALEQPTPGRMLYEWLRSSAEVASLHRLVTEQPRTLAELAHELWKLEDGQAERVVRWLTILGAHAAPAPRSMPLLPIRYHFFFRGLSGACICLASDCARHAHHPATEWSHLVLEDRDFCPDPECQAAMLPLQTCAHCGMPAVTVAESGGRWRVARGSGDERVFILTWAPDARSEADEEDAEEEDIRAGKVELCLNCRKFSTEALLIACCQRPRRRVLTIVQAGNGELKKCPRCGGAARPFPNVLQHFATGEDAPTAVLAEAAIRGLPPDTPSQPADGRRLLAFSDSRQRAAHFAPYLTRTSGDAQFLKPVVDAILSTTAANAEGATLQEIAGRFADRVRHRPFVVLRRSEEEGERGYRVEEVRRAAPDLGRRLRRECLISLFQHFAASPRSRRTIPSLALASAEVALNDYRTDVFRSRLPEFWRAGDEEAMSAIQNLLAVFLFRKALTFPDNITLRQIEDGPAAATFHWAEQGDMQGRRRYRWNPYLAQRARDWVVSKSYQAGVLAKFLELDRQRDGEQLNDLLTRFWDACKEVSLLQETHANEFQLDYELLVVRTDRTWHLCDRCGRFTVTPMGGRCPSPECPGSTIRQSAVELAERLKNHHWYRRLLEADPLCLEVREHTAQLTNKRGAEYQALFRDKRVNVLSSSTTFEMGVDVGQLKAVLLRNVPPTPANYIQRAGRAGRRQDGAAFSVCFARAMPHDQFHFHAPLDIVGGKVPVPQINLANSRLAQRHANSFLLGTYLLASASSIGQRLTVAGFFFEPSRASSPASGFAGWLRANCAQLMGPLGRIIPAAAGLPPERAIEQSEQELTGSEGVASRISDRLDAYGEERQQLIAVIQQSVNDPCERDRANSGLKSIEALIKQLRDESLIDCLSAEHWLPSYAFPQDVVRLLVRQDKYTEQMRLERDGEIGISEYAPGTEIIADGKLFRSRGIDLQHREPEVRKYRACPQCRRVTDLAEHDQMPGNCECRWRSRGRGARFFIRPRGFTTLSYEAVEEPDLFRLKPPPNSDVFLLSGAEESAFQPHPQFAGIVLGYSRHGVLFRANPGKQYQGFRVCLKCGRALDAGERQPHRTPWGIFCSGHLQNTDLVFKFETDTLQLRFAGAPLVPLVTEEVFWLSFQTAIVNASAEVLSVARNDIEGTYRSQRADTLLGELVIYDRVPGGAGYVERIGENLGQVLRVAYKRMGRCENRLCDEQASCYTCLRSYRNQFKWDKLKRAPVAEWLGALLGVRPSGVPA